jgi:hypothetical protein
MRRGERHVGTINSIVYVVAHCKFPVIRSQARYAHDARTSPINRLGELNGLRPNIFLPM